MPQLYLNSVYAGFPSPAEDFLDKDLDIHKYLIPFPESTFLVRVSGDSMKDIGILSEDILIVDRSKRPENRDIVVVAVNGDIVVKRISNKKGRIYLLSENKNYSPIEILDGDSFIVWGKVTGVIRKICSP